MEISTALREVIDDFEVTVNAAKPRHGSFELTLIDDGKETLLWSGIKLGPPRKMKFPEVRNIVESVQKAATVQ